VSGDPISRFDVAVLGAGMAGLGAADELRALGRSVAIIEAAPTVGGLARAIRVAGEAIEPYYHHIFPQDVETLQLITRLGLQDSLEWAAAPMGILHGGRVHAFDSALDLLRFPSFGLVDRGRFAVATGVQMLRRDRRTLDVRTAAAEGTRWYGKQVFETLWHPLLEAKFGTYADEVAMAWLVARIRQRAGGRRAGGDRLGYLVGSLGRLAETYANDLRRRDASIFTGSSVTRLLYQDGSWTVEHAGGTIVARAVVACVAGGVLAGLVDLPAPYRERVVRIPFRGIVCALVELDRPVSPYYWVNVTDRLGMGCVGIIEHTRFVSPAHYDGATLVYLAHYVEPADAAWAASPDDLLSGVEPSLRVLNPNYDRRWVRDIHVTRDRFAQPVPIAGGPMASLPLRTGLPALFHASLAHVYPDDRGVSRAIDAGRQAARLANAELV
jgi:protoporphyrinogen oxidase